jgi:hypothetical protein
VSHLTDQTQRLETRGHVFRRQQGSIRRRAPGALAAVIPCNPITNAAINPRRRLIDLLSPHRLPDTIKAEIHATIRFLKQQGTVDGQPAYRDHLGICMCLVTWTSAGYGLTATYGCAQELMLYAREPEFACKTIPILLITTQLCCALGLYPKSDSSSPPA